jgi:uncharacterized protein (TIGR00269 family)
MICSSKKCRKKAVICRRYEGRALCSSHFCLSFESKVKKTIRQFKLIKPKDRICVALSGGKDSAVTLFLLNNILKEWEVELFALAVDEGIRGYRDKSLIKAKGLCKKIKVDLHVISFKKEFGITLDEMIKNGRKACTLCGVLRRWLLNRMARRLGATKLATGHNLDDEIQSVLLNYLRGDLNRLLRLGPKPIVIEHPKFVPRIKPLRNIPELESGLYAMIKKLPIELAECPYTRQSPRFEIRDFLNEMEAKYPGIKFMAVRAYDSILPALQEKFANKIKLSLCKCGELTSRAMCKACELLVKR